MNTPQTYLIGAIAVNGMYGFGRRAHGEIPWHSPRDIGFFRETTKGNDVAMSSGMWEALSPQFRPLPKRGNIIVTRQSGYQVSAADWEKGARIALSTEEAKKMSKAEKLFFAGGEALWQAARPHVDVLLINVIGLEVFPPDGVEGVTFPHLLDPTKLWPEFVLDTDSEKVDMDENKYGTIFSVTYRRYVRQ